MSSVSNSNLYLVVIDGICGQCSESAKDMGIPGEPRENILHKEYTIDNNEFIL